MAVDQMVRKVQDALKVSKMQSKLPKALKVVDIRVEDYVDTDGEDALRVTVIIDEAVDVEKVSGRAVTDLKSAIRGRIRELGIDQWAYIQIAKQSEIDEADDEE